MDIIFATDAYFILNLWIRKRIRNQIRKFRRRRKRKRRKRIRRRSSHKRNKRITNTNLKKIISHISHNHIKSPQKNIQNTLPKIPQNPKNRLNNICLSQNKKKSKKEKKPKSDQKKLLKNKIRNGYNRKFPKLNIKYFLNKWKKRKQKIKRIKFKEDKTLIIQYQKPEKCQRKKLKLISSQKNKIYN